MSKRAFFRTPLVAAALVFAVGSWGLVHAGATPGSPAQSPQAEPVTAGTQAETSLISPRGVVARERNAARMGHRDEDPDDRVLDDYQLHCMGCHTENGKGLPGAVPSFPDDLGRLLTSPGGREFIGQVPGVSLSALSSERLAAVLNWLVRVYTPPELAAQIEPFTAQEVERMRQQPLLEVAKARSRL